MIAKITRGSRPGDIAAYLHGPGTANEHQWRDRSGTVHSGGIVIASTIGAEGQTDPARWVPEIRAAQQQRPEITKPIWQVSLRNAPTDRIMSDAQWADAGQSFAEHMGFDDHPWVMVRHGEDHVHIVVSRINDEGAVWHARNDRRQAQSACTALERTYDLEAAPRQRTQPRRHATQVHHQQRAKAQRITQGREQGRQAQQLAAASFPTSARKTAPAKQTPTPARPSRTPNRGREASGRD